MKQTSFLFIIFFVGVIVTACSDDEAEVVTPIEDCELTDGNLLFDQIDEKSDFESIESLLGSPTTTTVIDNNSVYTWHFCNNQNLYIRIIFTDGEIANKIKSFADETCNQNLTTSNFDLITLGQTTSEVLNILIDEGDTFAVNYNNTAALVITETITWYDCTNSDRRIKIQFENGIVIKKEKSF